MMLAQTTHILPLTVIRRERILPVPGRIVVRKGQQVSATDVVAEVVLSPEHMLLDVTRALGLPEEEADRHIQCRAGMRVAQGDVLAGPVGITKRVLRAPQDGRVIVAGDGQILLEVESPPYELRAGLPGNVTDLIDERGVVVETVGALVQGVWGNGRIDYGLLNVLIRSPDDVLTVDRLDISLRGSVVLGGYCADVKTIKAAANLPLRGLILAGMAPTIRQAATRAHFPIIVIEGFGQVGMNSAAYRLLTTNERREVAINAERWDRATGKRPEVVIPLPSSGEVSLPREVGEFEPDQRVRVLRAPYTGQIGTLVDFSPGATTLPSGVVALAARVRIENGEHVVVPLANLEVLA